MRAVAKEDLIRTTTYLIYTIFSFRDRQWDFIQLSSYHVETHSRAWDRRAQQKSNKASPRQIMMIQPVQQAKVILCVISVTRKGIMLHNVAPAKSLCATDTKRKVAMQVNDL